MATYDRISNNRSPWGCVLLCFLLLFALAGGGLLWYGWYQHDGGGLNPQAVPRAIEPRGSLSEFETANIKIYEQAHPSLVQVTNLTQQPGNWFSLNVQTVPKGVGSGFVWDQDGHIVTNYHVVQGADSAQVTLSDHSTYTAKQIWADADQDIAVIAISVPKAKLHPMILGTSHDLKVGQVTYALGDPFGLDQTMTIGIVSALGRTIDSANGRAIQGVIQTSAAINPGNSGGPLLDSAGRLIGMNTAILSPSGAFAGIGFAIPVDEINRIVPELIRNGKVVHPRLGIQMVNDELARQLGVEHGVLIVKVAPGSAAEKAGLQGTHRDPDGKLHLGDIIVDVDGKAVDSDKELYAIIQQHKVGDTLTLTIIRNGQRQDAKVTLGKSA